MLSDLVNSSVHFTLNTKVSGMPDNVLLSSEVLCYTMAAVLG